MRFEGGEVFGHADLRPAKSLSAGVSGKWKCAFTIVTSLEAVCLQVEDIFIILKNPFCTRDRTFRCGIPVGSRAQGIVDASLNSSLKKH